MYKYVSPLICFTINFPFFLIFQFINFPLHRFIFHFVMHFCLIMSIRGKVNKKVL